MNPWYQLKENRVAIDGVEHLTSINNATSLQSFLEKYDKDFTIYIYTVIKEEEFENAYYIRAVLIPIK